MIYAMFETESLLKMDVNQSSDELKKTINKKVTKAINDSFRKAGLKTNNDKLTIGTYDSNKSVVTEHALYVEYCSQVVNYVLAENFYIFTVCNMI